MFPSQATCEYDDGDKHTRNSTLLHPSSKTSPSLSLNINGLDINGHVNAGIGATNKRNRGGERTDKHFKG